MIKSSILNILKVSGIQGVMTNIFNVTLFSLYPQYLINEKKSITTLESEYVSGILNMKNILYYFVAWIVITGIYFLAARLGLKRLYRTLILAFVVVIFIVNNTSLGYSLHLLGYVLFVIFSLTTFTAFYFLVENGITRYNLKK